MPIFNDLSNISSVTADLTNIKDIYVGGDLLWSKSSDYPKDPVTFNYTGSVQTYIVPTGCSKLKIDCVGARGGGLNGGSSHAGKGGRVECDLSVTSNQILYIYVGGSGAASGGWNGGGQRNTQKTNYPDSGGGATDIRTVQATSGSWYDTTHSSWDTDTSLLSRLVVAGGGSGYSQQTDGASGGGLEGGVVSGGSSGTPCTSATQLSGGSGAVYSSGKTGSNGVFGKGGDGIVHSSVSGSGGGGGWYGGGGGAYVHPGGGGSSYTHPNKCSNVVHTQGYSAATGNGWLVITPY